MRILRIIYESSETFSCYADMMFNTGNEYLNITEYNTDVLNTINNVFSEIHEYIWSIVLDAKGDIGLEDLYFDISPEVDSRQYYAYLYLIEVLMKDLNIYLTDKVEFIDNNGAVIITREI